MAVSCQTKIDQSNRLLPMWACQSRAVENLPFINLTLEPHHFKKEDSYTFKRLTSLAEGLVRLEQPKALGSTFEWW